MNTVSIDNVQVSDGKVLVPFESGLARGWKEGPRIKPAGQIARPKIKLPYTEWRKALTFLVDVFDALKTEAHVLFYYHHEKQVWNLYCPHQVGTAGTTESIDCKANDLALEWLGRENFDCVGSVHSHCTMSAFQSGTDKTDEFSNTDGFHITIGKMNDEVMDIHCRSVCTILGDVVKETDAERIQLPFFLADFIDGLPDIDSAPFYIPHKMRDQILNWHLANRIEEEEYPQQWQTRVEEPPKKTWSYPTADTRKLQSGATVRVQGKVFKMDEKGSLVEIPDPLGTKEEQNIWQAHQNLRARIEDPEEGEELEKEEMALINGIAGISADEAEEEADRILEQQETERMIEEQGYLFGVS